jgi:excisionase family DNA binding protein
VAQEPHDQQRRKLLTALFGAEVPAVLDGQLLRTADVAILFQVSERTVSEWAKRGQIPSVRTPGGHRRYPAEGIRWMIEQSRNGPEARPGEAEPAKAESSEPSTANGEGKHASVTHLSRHRSASA